MNINRLIIFFAITFCFQLADCQTIAKGLVLDADTKEPIIGATVSDARKDKAITVTNADGQFVIPKNKDIKLKISYIGYKTLVTLPTNDGRYLMKAEISRLGEVVVTAQESRGLTSSSVIEKHAMEHLVTMIVCLTSSLMSVHVSCLVSGTVGRSSLVQDC